VNGTARSLGIEAEGEVHIHVKHQEEPERTRPECEERGGSWTRADTRRSYTPARHRGSARSIENG
jgi:hypothetical protein